MKLMVLWKILINKEFVIMFCVNCWYRVSRESCEDIEEGFLIEIGRIRRVFWRRGFMD